MADLNIKTWQERIGYPDHARPLPTDIDKVEGAMVAEIAELRAALAARSAVPAQAGAAEVPETTDEARAFLMKWHREAFMTAPYFNSYIETTLAGDFAYHLARWLAAQPPAQGEHSAGVGECGNCDGIGGLYVGTIHSKAPNGQQNGRCLICNGTGRAATAQGDGEHSGRVRYTCIGKGGEYELIGRACAAGQLRDVLVSNDYPVYRDIESGMLFVRVGPDFDARMEPVAAAHKAQQERGQ